MEEKSEKLMTVKETAEYLRTTPATIYTYMCIGKLPKNLYTKFGRKVLFSKKRIDEMLFTPEPVKNLESLQNSIFESIERMTSI